MSEKTFAPPAKIEVTAPIKLAASSTPQSISLDEARRAGVAKTFIVTDVDPRNFADIDQAQALEAARRKTLSHTISKGETVTRLAARYGISVDDIHQANTSKFPSKQSLNNIEAQSQIIIPRTGDSIYQVQKGDSVGKIAETHNKTVQDLVKANPILARDVNNIKIDQELVIPK